MIKFDIEGSKVIISPETLTIKAFRDIWDYDKSPDKELASRMLTFVYHFMDLDSPFAGADYKERYELCRAENGLPKDMSEEESKLLEEACRMYDEEHLNDSAEKRFLRIWDEKIDQLRELVERTTPEIKSFISKTGEVKYTTNTSILTKIMNEMDALMKTKEALEARLKNKSTDIKIQGQKSLSMLESGEVT